MCVDKLDLYGTFCNIFPLKRLYEGCKLHRFAELTIQFN